MGLFSSKKKVYVSAITERMLEDKDFKYSHEYAMQDWLFSNNSLDLNSKTNLSDITIDYRNSNLPNKYNRLYRLAKNKNNYIFGLPKDTLLSNPIDTKDIVIQEYLESVELKPVELIYNFIDDRNYEHTAWLKLIEVFGYSGLNNELKVLSKEIGFKCYLLDGYMCYTEATHIEYSIAESEEVNKVLPFNYGKCFDRELNTERVKTPSILGETDKYIFTFKYLDKDKKEIIATREIDLSWISSPTLETTELNDDNALVQTGYLVDNEYKFFTYEFLSGNNIDIDTKFVSDVTVGNYYPRIYLRIDKVDTVKSTNTLKKKHTKKALKILGLDLEEVTTEVNKGIGKDLKNVINMYLDMSVKINAVKDDVIQAEYLFKYFSQLNNKSGEATPTNSNGFMQSIQDNQSTLIVKYDSINKEINSGKAKNSKNINLKTGEYCVSYNDNTHIISYQIKDNEYINLNVIGLTTQTEIKDKTATNNNKDENLSLPLDKSIVSKLNPRERELLFNKCFCVEIQTHIEVKQKWWQSTIFKVIMTAISIAISVFTAGAGSPISAIIQSVLIGAATGIAIGYVINVLVKVAVKLGVSAKVLAVLVLLGTLTAMAKGGNVNTIKAVDVMKALNKSFAIYNKTMQIKLLEINKQLKDFQAYANNKDAELKEKQAMLFTGVIPLSLELLTNPMNSAMYVNLGETPEEFYTRTKIHDVTQIVLEYTTNYTELMLQLPKKIKPLVTEDVESILLIN